MESIHSIISKKSIVATSGRTPRKEEFVLLPDHVAKNELSSLTMKELMKQEFPDSEWVVNRLIPEGLTVLSAQPASFKTWLLLDIAIAVSLGNPLFGTFDTKKSGVLIVDEENSARLLQQRLLMLQERDDLPIHFMIEQNFKLEDAKVSKIIKFCHKNDIKLLTFDSLVRIHNSNENDAVQMSEVFAKVRKFNKAGINVLVTHHNRKTGKSENASQDMRGSSDILAAVDCHLSLKRDKEQNRLVITQTKVRFSEELEPIEVQVVANEEKLTLEYLGTKDIGESKRKKNLRLINEILAELGEVNQKEMLLALEEQGNKINAKTLRSILQEMEEAVEIITTHGRGSEILYSLAK